MRQSNVFPASKTLMRLPLAGLTAVIGAAAGAWISLASIAGPGLRPSYARQRRGRAG